jgi:hypothetical protein
MASRPASAAEMPRPVAVALTVAAAVLAAALGPRVSRFLIAAAHDPRRLPALAADARVHFEPAAEGCARAVAAALPGAIRIVEAAHGRPFAQAPAIGVFASYETYAKANGFSDPTIAAVTLDGRIALSPTLCGDQRERMAGVLAHEVSHAHLFGWRGLARRRPPSWFVEGLAVMVSGGGGAESVGEAEALARIRDGHALVVDDEVWADFAAIRFTGETAGDFAKYDRAYRQNLGFRQAAMLVRWLADRDGAALLALLRRLEAGEAFPAAFRSAYGAEPATLASAYREDILR